MKGLIELCLNHQPFLDGILATSSSMTRGRELER